MTFVINLMTTGLEGMNRLPGAVWRLYPTKITLAMLAVLPILLYLLIDERARCVRVKLIYTIGGLLIVSTASEIVRLHLEDIQPRLIVYNLPHTTAVHFLVSRDSSWIYSSSSPDTTRLQMERITQNYLRPHGIRQPLPLILKNLDNQHLIKRGETFVFGDETTIILRRNIAPLDSPKSLSLLIIGRGCRMKPEDLFRSLRPRQVVLDASLTPFYRQRLKNFCLKMLLPSTIQKLTVRIFIICHANETPHITPYYIIYPLFHPRPT